MKQNVFLFSLLFILLSCSSDNSVTLPEENSNIAEVRTKLKQSLLNHGIPGGVIAVFDGDAEILITEGYSNIETLTPITGDMKFRIASNTKTFTARRILLLIDEGKLNLEDKLIDHLPDCEILYADTLTIKQLLNHTSGIANYNGQPAFTNVWFENPLYEWSTEEILNLIRNSTPDFYPGTPDAWNYSDSNYFLLGLIIEKITKNSAGSEITEKVINALNLANTIFPTTSDMPSGYCTGYRFNAEQNSLVDASRISPTAPWTGGAIISNAYDIGKWVKELGSGTFLSSEMREKCFDFFPSSPGSALTYGLGLMEINGLRGHTGMIQGYESCMLYSPVNDVSIVVWVNRCNEDQGIQPAVSLCVHTFQKLYPELF